MAIILFLFALICLVAVKATKPAGFCKKVKVCKKSKVNLQKRVCKNVTVRVAKKNVLTQACTNVPVPTVVTSCNNYWSCLKTLKDKKPTLHLIKQAKNGGAAGASAGESS